MNEQDINQELKTLLENWDKGELIHTIEMGGIGPGYEQAIQITIFEMLRQLLEAQPSRAEEDYTTENLDPIVEKANPAIEHLGLSGAQWFAARSVATTFYFKGYEEARKTFPEDRKLLVSNHFPQSQKPEEVAK